MEVPARCQPAMEARRRLAARQHDAAGEWQLGAVDRIFDEAFGQSSGASSPPSVERPVDLVELSPQGLRLDYSRATADWLAPVSYTHLTLPTNREV